MKNNILIKKPVIIYDNNETIFKYSYLYNEKQYSFSNKYSYHVINPYMGIESVISVFIPHCILTGTIINSDIPVDKVFLNNIQNIVPIFRKLHKNDKLELNINIPPIEHVSQFKDKKILSTFTLGVDSFYTLY